MLGTSGRVSGLAFIHILIVYTWYFLPTMSCDTGSGTHDYADGRKHSFVLQWSVYRWEHHQQVAGKDTAVPRIKEGWDVKRNVMYLFDNEASSVQNPQKHQVWRGRCPGHLSLCHQHASASKAARQLGVLAEELAKTLTYKTIYTQETLHCAAECKLECSTEGPAHVWPLCYLMANYNLAPCSQAPLCSATQIMLLDPAGFHLLSSLIWVASIILLQLHQ